MTAVAAVALLAFVAAPALADTQTSARDIQAALDNYLSTDGVETNLVGGPGSAGYDDGFWIRGGDFLLRTNVTLQARFEVMDYDETQRPETTAVNDPTSGGDLSGFSLPRATLKFSGEAPCNIRYYVELEFGHFGRDAVDRNFPAGAAINNLGPGSQSYNYDNTREAWIEWGMSDMFNFRMGQVATPTTRQLMTAPELQQFVDISLASAFVGQHWAGYTDRNRDHGFLIHGSFGCDNEWSYILSVTNGDGGDSIRNVLDVRTSDNLAYGLRINWAFLKPIGYQEGALRQDTCSWFGEFGVWANYYADRTDKLHTIQRDALRFGADLALGYGGFSMTGAFTIGTDETIGGGNGTDIDYTAWLVQLGYHFPGTAWEIAARVSSYDVDAANAAAVAATPLATAAGGASVLEYAFGINYYVNGHGNKLSLDVSIIEGQDNGSVLLWDAYAGYGDDAAGSNTYGILLRFQWQLAL